MKAKLKKIIKYSPAVALSITMVACMYIGMLTHTYAAAKHQPLR